MQNVAWNCQYTAVFVVVGLCYSAACTHPADMYPAAGHSSHLCQSNMYAMLMDHLTGPGHVNILTWPEQSLSVVRVHNPAKKNMAVTQLLQAWYHTADPLKTCIDTCNSRHANSASMIHAERGPFQLAARQCWLCSRHHRSPGGCDPLRGGQDQAAAAEGNQQRVSALQGNPTCCISYSSYHIQFHCGSLSCLRCHFTLLSKPAIEPHLFLSTQAIYLAFPGCASDVVDIFNTAPNQVGPTAIALFVIKLQSMLWTSYMRQ